MMSSVLTFPVRMSSTRSAGAAPWSTGYVNRRDELERVSTRAKLLVDGHPPGPPSSARHEAVADDGGILFSRAQDSGRECRMVGRIGKALRLEGEARGLAINHTTATGDGAVQLVASI